MPKYLPLSIIFFSQVSVFGQLYGWDSNVAIPALGRDDAVCFTLDEIVFVGTGNHGGFAESNVFYAYNTRNGQFEDVAPFPGVARQYALVEEVGFKAYLIAGIDEFSNPLNDVWEYDLIEDKWNQKSDFPGPNRWKASSFMVGGKIYYGTGRNWTTSFNDFWEYNPATDVWKQLEDMPVLPRDETVGFSVYERGYIGLGMDCTGVMQSDIWKYDPFGEEWSYETEFPGGARWYAIAENLNGYAYIGTGEDEMGNMYQDFWEYNPSTGVWASAENLPNPPRRGVSACTIPFKGIYLACGLDESFNRLADISRYTDRNLNPPPLNVFYQYEDQKVYINDLPSYSFVRVINLQGKMCYETNERTDHLMVDVAGWSKGVYIVWVGKNAGKFILR